MTNPQEEIKRYLQARGIATSVELQAFTWDFRKAITRLRRDGMQIISRKVKGKKYHEYLLYQGQMKLF
jgi:hypothetical protein